jgi:hypothetical protein
VRCPASVPALARDEVAVGAVSRYRGHLWSLPSLKLVLDLLGAEAALQAQLHATAGATSAATAVRCPFSASHDAGLGGRLEHPAVVGGIWRRHADYGRVQVVDGRGAHRVVACRPRGCRPRHGEARASRRRARRNVVQRSGRLVHAPQVFVFSLVALVVPRLVLDGVVAQAQTVGAVGAVHAAATLAHGRVVGAGGGDGARAAGVGPACSSRGRPWSHAYLLLPVRVGASGRWVLVGVGVFQLQLVLDLPCGARSFPSLSAIRVAGAGGARGVVEDGALHSS